MPPLQQHITFLYTPDLTTSAHFYEEILGLTLWLDQGTCRIYHLCGAAYVGICQRAEATRQPENLRTVIITLVTDQVDEWYEILKARGVEFEKTPQLNPQYQIYHCFLRDPNGYLLEIQQFLNAPPLL